MSLLPNSDLPQTPVDIAAAQEENPVSPRRAIHSKQPKAGSFKNGEPDDNHLDSQSEGASQEDFDLEQLNQYEVSGIDPATSAANVLSPHN